MTILLLAAIAAFFIFGAWLLRHMAFPAMAAVAILFAVPAAAQGVEGFGIIDRVAPPLLEIVGIFLGLALTWAAAKAKQKFGIDIEAKHREALHLALMSAARLAIANKLTGQKAVDMIIDYVYQSVPDAVAGLRPSAGVLDDLARSKLQAVGEDILTRALQNGRDAS